MSKRIFGLQFWLLWGFLLGISWGLLGCGSVLSQGEDQDGGGSEVLASGPQKYWIAKSSKLDSTDTLDIWIDLPNF